MGKMKKDWLILDRCNATNIIVGNALVDMYANNGGLAQAQEIFSGF